MKNDVVTTMLLAEIEDWQKSIVVVKGGAKLKKKKVVYIEENMIDENELVVFGADIPYVVERGYIKNENNELVPIRDIWVDFRLVHQEIQ